ncbi:MAG: caspase domain-containing protein, partial [Desulfobacterales bacterium]
MILRKFTVLVLFLSLLWSSVALFAQERGIKLHVERLALVIGNSAYQTASLKNPLNDAEDMAATLRKLGFKVILKKDADQRSMEDAIRSFGRQLRNGGIGLFYFAGHGLQIGGRNYLIPVDARIESESDVKYEAVDAGRVLGKMEDARNQLNIVILDACRNNPYARAFRSDQSGLARMDAPTGSLIAYATAPGDVAADGPERNGIFTKHLIQHMKTPNLTIEQVLKRVRIDVARQTNGLQIPWESSSLMGDFYFNFSKTSGTVQTSEVSSPADNERETLAAIPKTTEKIRRPDSRFKLAIFPWKLDIYYKYNRNVFYDIFFDALKNSLKSYDNIFLKYSYYQHDEFGNEIELIKEIFSEEGSLVWTKKSFIDAPSPNLDEIIRIADKINADLVMMHYIRVVGDNGNAFNCLYLIDPKEKVVINKKYND